MGDVLDEQCVQVLIEREKRESSVCQAAKKPGATRLLPSCFCLCGNGSLGGYWHFVWSKPCWAALGARKKQLMPPLEASRI